MSSYGYVIFLNSLLFACSSSLQIKCPGPLHLVRPLLLIQLEEKNLTELTSTAEAITASEEFLLAEVDDSLEETEDESDEVWEI